MNKNNNASNKKDGGYPAISGFFYQFDKTIYEILNNDKNVYFECIEDINTDTEIIQVKQYSSSKYSKSLIKNAILGLFNNFKNNSCDVIPILYGFVKESKEEKDIKKDISEILNENIEGDINESKNKFLQVIIVDLHEENSLKQQEESTKNKIKEVFNCNTDDLMEQTYCNTIYKIIEIILENKEDKSKRFLNKNELISFIKNREKRCFTQLYCDYKTEDKYINSIKKEHFKQTNLSNSIRLFIIDCEIGIECLKKICEIIIKNYNDTNDYNNRNKQYSHRLAIGKQTYYSPYIYIKDINEENLLEIKNSLLYNQFNVIDGFQFQNSKFEKNFLFRDDKFVQLKFINNDEIFNDFIKHEFQKTKDIYCFYDKKCNFINCENIKQIYIKGLEFINKII